VPGLSCGAVCVILRLSVLVELRTDRWTDRHRGVSVDSPGNTWSQSGVFGFGATACVTPLRFQRHKNYVAAENERKPRISCVVVRR